MTRSSRAAERADLDRLLGQDTPPAWTCTRHQACTCPPPLHAEHCPTHGDYTPTSGLDADCPQCEDESARRDAEHTYRWQLDTPAYYRYR